MTTENWAIYTDDRLKRHLDEKNSELAMVEVDIRKIHEELARRADAEMQKDFELGIVQRQYYKEFRLNINKYPSGEYCLGITQVLWLMYKAGREHKS